VPTAIIDVDRTPFEGKALSDFVVINKDAKTGAVTVSVLDTNQNVIYSLNGFQLMQDFNHIDATVHADNGNFKGIMGIFEQVASDLFLKDGIYSLWARDEADPAQTGKLPSSNMYGTHPMFMARGKDGADGTQAWIGGFYNLANAQDWRVMNDASSGEVNLKTYSAGGLGDLFFFTGVDPNEIVTKYHTIVGTPVLTPQWALGWNQCRWGYNSTA